MSALLIPSLIFPVIVHAGLISFVSDIFSGAPTAQAGSETEISSPTPVLEAPIAPDPEAVKAIGTDITIDDAALMPETGPSGTAADVVDDEESPSQDFSLYVTHKGDTLSAIAEMFDLKTDTILSANPTLKRGSPLTEDLVLTIPPADGILYTVVKGDNLQSIAKKFKIDSADIGDANGITGESTLSVGDTLFVPNAVAIAAAPIKSKTKSGTSSAVSGVSSSRAKSPALAGKYSRKGNARGTLSASIPGYYVHPVTPGACHISQWLHDYDAIDCAGPIGTPIYAVAEGTVIAANFQSAHHAWFSGFGNYIMIAHPNGTESLYAHLSGVSVSVGEHVSRGQKIGKMGDTGKTTGPHLHFEAHGFRNPYTDNSFID